MSYLGDAIDRGWITICIVIALVLGGVALLLGCIAQPKDTKVPTPKSEAEKLAKKYGANIVVSREGTGRLGAYASLQEGDQVWVSSGKYETAKVKGTFATIHQRLADEMRPGVKPTGAPALNDELPAEGLGSYQPSNEPHPVLYGKGFGIRWGGDYGAQPRDVLDVLIERMEYLQTTPQGSDQTARVIWELHEARDLMDGIDPTSQQPLGKTEGE